jgi:hypothetical protein
MLTLQKLLAGILLEESLVDNRAGKIVDHQLQNRLDLFLAISRVVCKTCILVTLALHKGREVH